jgi:hypothetical protein
MGEERNGNEVQAVLCGRGGSFVQIVREGKSIIKLSPGEARQMTLDLGVTCMKIDLHDLLGHLQEKSLLEDSNFALALRDYLMDKKGNGEETPVHRS